MKGIGVDGYLFSLTIRGRVRKCNSNHQTIGTLLPFEVIFHYIARSRPFVYFEIDIINSSVNIYICNRYDYMKLLENKTL